MARDISIAISAKDNFTDALKKMQTSQTAFRKDLGQLNEELTLMNKTKVNLKVDLVQAKNELKQAEKQFKALGDEANRNKLIMAQTNYDNVKRNFDLVGSGAKQAEKDIRNLTDTMSKAENRVSQDKVSSGKFNASNLSKNIEVQSRGLFSELAQAGLYNMVGESLSGAMSVGITSALGSTTGNALGSIFGGAATGAAMGSVIPGLGTAVGTMVGTVAGGIGAITQVFSSKDDAFKSVVQSNYELTKEIQKTSLQNGKGLAGKREQDMISYSTILGGEDNASRFLTDIQKFSAKTPFEMNDLLDTSKVMLSYGYKQDEIIPTMTKIGDTGSALGIDADNQKVVATALGRMKSSGKASLEYINQLSERAIPAIDYLGEALGKTNKEIYEMISKGAIDGAKASQIIVDAMGSQFEGNMAKQSATYEGLVSSLNDAWAQMDQAMGEGYNEERKKGMEAELNSLNGAMGDQLKEANRLIGEYQASLENGYQQSIISSMNNASKTKEYSEAQLAGNGAEMGRILAQARSDAENAFKASEGYQMQIQSDKALIGRIREDTSLQSEYWNTGYTMGQEFNKGILAAKSQRSYDAVSPLISPGTGVLPNTSNKHAFGLNYVPYDNYPAILHQGEKVVPAVEARSEKSSQPIQIIMNDTLIREEADIDKVATRLYDKMQKASINTVKG